MFKKAAFFFLFLSGIFACTGAIANPSRIEAYNLNIQKIDCSYYFQKVTIGDKMYLIEYDDTDGSIISVIEIYE